jgi:hypothetical protein
MDDNEDGHRIKRFKVGFCFPSISQGLTSNIQHQSYNQSLKEVHLPAAHNQTPLDNEIGVRIIQKICVNV